jgi:hypothetical protein
MICKVYYSSIEHEFGEKMASIVTDMLQKVVQAPRVIIDKHARELDHRAALTWNLP